MCTGGFHLCDRCSVSNSPELKNRSVATGQTWKRETSNQPSVATHTAPERIAGTNRHREARDSEFVPSLRSGSVSDPNAWVSTTNHNSFDQYPSALFPNLYVV
jgi:hypothetical protein